MALTLTSTLTLTLALGACGNDGDSTDPTDPGTDAAPTATSGDDQAPDQAPDPDLAEPGDGQDGESGRDDQGEIEAQPPANGDAGASENGTPASGPDQGQSQEEAEQAGTLTGDYDLLLHDPTGPIDLDGCLQYRVQAENVGKLTDTYTFTADAGWIDTGQPDRLQVVVEPGRRADVTVEICDPSVESVTLDAHSEGRAGQLVAQITIP